MVDVGSVFENPEALRINRARLDHLASLGLNLHGKRVLEVGAGIGLHTGFFEERGCTVLSTDGRPENVAEMLSRYPTREVGLLDLDRSADLRRLGLFDIVYCYGTLYHLADPERAIERLASLCRGQILVETLVSAGEDAELHYVREPITGNQALEGVGCRPTRPWVMRTLRRHLGYAYTTLTQPDYPDFELDWTLTRGAGNMRAIFVGSRFPLSAGSLTSVLPRQHLGATVPATRPVGRIWIDVGAFRGDASLQAAQADPELTVHAFEPQPSLAASLMRSGPANFVTHPMAVAETDGMACLHVNAFAAASSLLPMDEAARQTWIGGEVLRETRSVFVPTVRLDTFMSEHSLREVEYLKIDAQGADLSVVRSAGARLRDIRTIKLEVQITGGSLYQGSASKAEVAAFMDAHGFELSETELQSHGQEENLTFVRRA